MPCYILKIVNHTFNFVMVFSYWICRLGFLVSYVFSCSVLQTSRGELVQGKNCWFFLHALIWCLCIDWNCSSWGNDTLLVRVICKNYIPQQLIDVYDGELHFVYTFVVESSCSNPSQTLNLNLPFSGLCMEQTESLHSHELPRSLYFHGCLPSMGA
jgi:hypothetical protein